MKLRGAKTICVYLCSSVTNHPTDQTVTVISATMSQWATAAAAMLRVCQRR